MISGIRLKICGLRSLVDAEAADAIGADFFGFNFHASSPRHLTLRQWQAMAPALPERKRVAVSVLPSIEDLRAWRDAGLDAFQIHFSLETPEERVAAWSAVVGPDRLWLAPKLPPGKTVPASLLRHAKTILVDTFSTDAYGGTGRTGDWAAFRAMRETNPEHAWVLAGGLSALNIAAALEASGTRFVDLSSGVEAAPGIKDPAKLRVFALAVRRAREPGTDPAAPRP